MWSAGHRGAAGARHPLEVERPARLLAVVRDPDVPEDRLRGTHGTPIRPRPSASLGGDQPPVVAAGRRAGAPARPRPAGPAAARRAGSGPPSPCDHGDDLGAVGDAPDRRRRASSPAPPQATTSSLGEADRVAARRSAPRRRPGRPGRPRRCGSPPAPPSRRSAFVAPRRRRVELDQRGERRLLGVGRHDHHGRPSSASSAASSAARITFGEFGQHEDLLAPARSRSRRGCSSVDGFRVGPPSTTIGAEPLEQRRMPVAAATATTPGARRRRAARSRSAICSRMSAMSSLRDRRRRPSKSAFAALGVVGVDVDLQRRRVADDQDRVADLLEQRDEGAARRGPSPVTMKFVQYRKRLSVWCDGRGPRRLVVRDLGQLRSARPRARRRSRA